MSDLTGILFLVLLIAIPWVTIKLTRSKRLNDWIKYFLAFLTVSGGIFLLFCMLVLHASYNTFQDHNLPKRVSTAKQYLKSVNPGVDFPKFKVDSHTYEYVGGDDTEEKWEISFTKPLQDSFISELDSLCANGNWRKYFYNQAEPYYEFSTWNDIEIRNTIRIYPTTNRATFSHMKI